MYNLTNITNSNNFFEVFQAVNNEAMGLLFAFLLFSLFLIVLVVFHNYPLRYSVVGASMLCTIVGVIGFNLGFIGLWILILPILVLLGSILASYFIE